MPVGEVSAMSDWTISYMEVRGSIVEGHHNAVLVSGAGAVGAFDEDASSDGETGEDVEAYGAPGIVFRPRPPEEVDTPDGKRTLQAEAMAARVAGDLVPLAWRDLRFNRVYSAPKSGSVALVGYGGGFHSLEDTQAKSGDKLATTHVIYAPFDYAGDIPQKAHAIIIDSEPEPAPGVGGPSISIMHGAGQMILMNDEGQLTLASADGDYLQVEPGKITLQAAQLVLNGGAVVVGNPMGAIVPLTPGAASPPCPRLWLNPAA
jgi:hypothetical protein